MEEDKVLVSESKSNYFSIFVLIILITASLIFYTQMIVAVSWLGCITSLILVVVAIYSSSNYFKNTYYFSDKSIVIKDHKSEYIGEMECNNLVAWNEYETTRKGTKYYRVVIQNHERKVSINKEDYKNYDAIVSYCTRSKFRKDITINESFSEGIEEFNSKLNNKIGIIAMISGLGLLLLFGIVVSFKNDTGVIQYYLGEINTIKFTTGKYKRVNGVLVKLKKFPSLQFSFQKKRDIEYFKQVDTLFYKPKKIKIGISKDYYDWKTKNDFIKLLDLSDGTNWYVEQYEMLEK